MWVISKDPKTRFDADEIAFIDRVLSEAWNSNSADSAGKSTRNARTEATRTGPQRPALGWFDSLDGYGTLDSSHDLRPPGITSLDGQTIHCQAAQSYTQWVPLHDVDSAQTICPVGHSDRPGGPYRTSTLELWGTARLHPAPLSRKAVERITAERTLLLP